VKYENTKLAQARDIIVCDVINYITLLISVDKIIIRYLSAKTHFRVFQNLEISTVKVLPIIFDNRLISRTHTAAKNS